MTTADELKNATLTAGLREVPHHQCEIDGGWTKYLVTPTGEIWYDASCIHIQTSPVPTNWEEVAYWINSQPAEKQAELASRFGVVEVQQGEQ